MPQNVTRRRRKSGNENRATAGANGVPVAPGSADGGGNGAAAGGHQNLWNREEFKKTVVQSIIRALLMYLALRYIMYQQKNGGTNKSGDAANADGAAPKPAGRQPVRTNIWGANVRYDVRAFTSMHSTMTFQDAVNDVPFYASEGFTYTLDQENYRGENVTLQVPREVTERNTSWYAHIFVTKQGAWEIENPHPTKVLYTSHNLVSWHKGPIIEEGTNLLGNKKDEEVVSKVVVAAGKDEIIQLVKPVMTIGLVTDYSPFSTDTFPLTISHRYKPADEAAGFPTYYPPLFVNEFWLLADMLRPINSTVTSTDVEVIMEPISMKKWALQAQFDATMEMQISYGAASAKEKDKIKRMILDTNPVLLAVTMIVSLAHSVLEALAFRNDVSHWKSIKSMEGISVRSMGVKIFMEVVIFLYLLDNDTSWMIIIGNAVGIAIEVWKLGKAVEFSNFGKVKLLGIIPWFETKDRDSYSKQTKEYDEQAMKYLSWVAYPLVALYSVYSLVYEKHKSWYSWILGSLVGAVYAFGFLLMVPAVYINYKLKSVAHLPMRALMYKSLNTIIDDLFSFVIKMPWMHRIACFRDDVIFLIFLYQCWIYPVDKSRVNEFGQSFNEDGTERIEPRESSTTTSTTSTTGAKKKKGKKSSAIQEETSKTADETSEKKTESKEGGEEAEEIVAKDPELKKSE